MHTVYKVVRVIDGKYFSSFSWTFLPLRLEYKIGCKVRCIPRTLGLFVFTDLQTAKYWRSVWGDVNRVTTGTVNMRVLRCESEIEPHRLDYCQTLKNAEGWYSQLISYMKWSWKRRVADFERNAPSVLYTPGGTHVVPRLVVKEIVK